MNLIVRANQEKFKEVKAMCEALEELMKDELEAKKVEGITETILDLLFELGSVPELLQSEIMKQKNPEILKQWVKYAARADTVEAFEQKIRKAE